MKSKDLQPRLLYQQVVEGQMEGQIRSFIDKKIKLNRYLSTILTNQEMLKVPL